MLTFVCMFNSVNAQSRFVSSCSLARKLFLFCACLRIIERLLEIRDVRHILDLELTVHICYVLAARSWNESIWNDLSLAYVSGFKISITYCKRIAMAHINAEYMIIREDLDTISYANRATNRPNNFKLRGFATTCDESVFNLSCYECFDSNTRSRYD